MTRHDALRAALAVGLTLAIGAAPADLNAMRWRRRILIVAAPGRNDERAEMQRRIFEAWSGEAAARDVSLVEISGAHVAGVSDTATSLRRRYRLSPNAFQVLLLGKDGQVALRSARPVDAATLQGRIDAMPMRQAGER